MNVAHVPTSQDQALEEAFGAPVAELYSMVSGMAASATLMRALELRSFLAVAEEQMARVRDRVLADTADDHDRDALTTDDLRWDVQWLEAALTARADYIAALGKLLHAMRPAPVPGRPLRASRQKSTTGLAPAGPARECRS
ncbi:hypothetical protein [Streptomyces sp. AK02-01A]|uniref:hypothetical protein n=1 Tax=Streptomyces sp. AK02-01A TaxID=3028648 RepID=UPI0029CA1DD7|nr:hypothetical protein [Streptomyces sp. AK02-01A]